MMIASAKSLPTASEAGGEGDDAGGGEAFSEVAEGDASAAGGESAGVDASGDSGPPPQEVAKVTNINAAPTARVTRGLRDRRPTAAASPPASITGCCI